MKHNKPYRAFLLFLSLLSLYSCGDSSDAASQDAVPVAETIRVSVHPMEDLETVTTRTEEAAQSEALQVRYMPTKSTRANVDKTTEEKEIKSAYIVLFNGTTASSTATWVSGNVATNLNSGSSVDCNLLLTAGVKSRVYVVANPKSVPTVGTILQTFETVAYTVSTLPAMGLPMAAFQDVSLGETLGVFRLKSPLARLTFTTSTGTLTLRGIPSVYSLATSVAGATAVRPSGVTYTNTASLTSGTPYYVPANLSGQVDLSSSELRCSLFAPANSMYVSISANSTTYNVYLGDGSASDFNVVSNFAYAVNITLKGNGGGSDLRLGTPAITDLSASGTANCYIATSSNTWYSFNGKVMGNGATTKVPANMSSDGVASDIVPTALNPVSTDVLWETWNTTTTPTAGSVVPLTHCANGKIYFFTGAYEGNAVVAARDASNTIIWSWHIWRINTDPTLPAHTATTTSYTSTEGTFDDTKTTTHPGLTMMKLNLGALSSTPGDDLASGLFYQWGRKDPFKAVIISTNTETVITPASAFTIASGGASITPADAVKNPSVFYCTNTGDDIRDWTTRNDNLWGTPMTKTVISSDYNSNYGSKSIYDPCPPAWRVPPAYAYANATRVSCPWDVSKYGRDFIAIFSGSPSVWFPASGLRSGIQGALSSVGIRGGYWTSTPRVNNSTLGHALGFHSSFVGPINGEYRAYGYSIRCVKE